MVMTAKSLGCSPYPWTAEVDNEERDDGPDEILSKDGIVIARVEGVDAIRRRILKGKVEGPGCNASADAADEVDNNARIMAVAPKMLDACMMLLDSMAPQPHSSPNDRYFVDQRKTSQYRKALDEMREIVAKLRGE